MVSMMTPAPLRRVLITMTVVAIGVAAVVAIGYAIASRPARRTALTGPPSTGTAAVTRGSVTERIQIGGTLGFAGSYTVVYQGAEGILTSVPAAGTTVRQGGILYTVANQPVHLLLGNTPAFRDFAAGMTDGPDVRQLEQDLVALGMDPSHQIHVDNHFTWATGTAIQRWQGAWGWPSSRRTGQLPLGEVAFMPVILRVAGVTAMPGTAIGPNAPVLSATSTTRVVVAQVTTDRVGLVHPGAHVLVTLPGAAPARGTVTNIGQAAPPGASAAPGDSTGGPATVPVTISVTLPKGTAELNQTPVQVGITTDAHQNVLRVPVTALLARAGGGYQVRLQSGAYVDVEPGLYDDDAGLVEVTGAGLAAGQQVEVPAS